MSEKRKQITEKNNLIKEECRNQIKVVEKQEEKVRQHQFKANLKEIAQLQK